MKWNKTHFSLLLRCHKLPYYINSSVVFSCIVHAYSMCTVFVCIILIRFRMITNLHIYTHKYTKYTHNQVCRTLEFYDTLHNITTEYNDICVCVCGHSAYVYRIWMCIRYKRMIFLLLHTHMCCTYVHCSHTPTESLSTRDFDSSSKKQRQRKRKKEIKNIQSKSTVIQKIWFINSIQFDLSQLHSLPFFILLCFRF